MVWTHLLCGDCPWGRQSSLLGAQRGGGSWGVYLGRTWDYLIKNQRSPVRGRRIEVDAKLVSSCRGSFCFLQIFNRLWGIYATKLAWMLHVFRYWFAIVSVSFPVKMYTCKVTTNSLEFTYFACQLGRKTYFLCMYLFWKTARLNMLVGGLWLILGTANTEGRWMIWFSKKILGLNLSISCSVVMRMTIVTENSFLYVRTMLIITCCRQWALRPVD